MPRRLGRRSRGSPPPCQPLPTVAAADATQSRARALNGIVNKKFHLLHRLSAWTDSQIATLYPGAFALVMATGIISNALLADGWRHFSDLLWVVAALAYSLLAILTVWRAVRFGSALWADLANPRVVFSFFTIVAGTAVLGEGIGLRGYTTIALDLWLCALLLWVVLVYFSFGVLTLLNTPKGADIAHGGWLLACVGTQSLVTLGALVARSLGAFDSGALVLIQMLWSVGLGLYALYVVLFAYRVFYFDFEPDDFTPVLWVVMGAAAISTDAGAALFATDTGVPFLRLLRPLVGGVTLFTWAWAAWWIPLLLVLEIWKHGVRHAPLTYTPLRWCMVFPLGMFAVASFRLSLAADFPTLRPIAEATLLLALTAWVVTFVALIVASWRSFRAYAQPFSPVGRC
jgi:tellurite resistance protein TehA-like permease